MSEPSTNGPFLPVLVGFCLTLVYFAVGFGAYLAGQPGRERLREAGRTLVRLSPVPAVLGLVPAGPTEVSGFGFRLGSAAAIVLALGVPALAVASAFDGHAVD